MNFRDHEKLAQTEVFKDNKFLAVHLKINEFKIQINRLNELLKKKM